jgi:hypothetical protein
METTKMMLVISYNNKQKGNSFKKTKNERRGRVHTLPIVKKKQKTYVMKKSCKEL